MGKKWRSRVRVWTDRAWPHGQDRSIWKSNSAGDENCLRYSQAGDLEFRDGGVGGHILVEEPVIIVARRASSGRTSCVLRPGGSMDYRRWR